MSAVESSGTQTATLTTEHTLAAPTTVNKTRVLDVDATALVAGETLTLRMKGPVLSGGTHVLRREAVFVGPLGEPGITSLPLFFPFGATITLTQTGGTGRAFPWSINTLD